MLSPDARFDDVRWDAVTFDRIGIGFGLDALLLRAALPGSAMQSAVIKIAADWPAPSEPYFYDHLAPRIPVRFADCYASASAEDRFALVVEDLGDLSQGDCLIGATDPQVKNLVASIATVHACFWEGTDDALQQMRRLRFDPDRVLAGFEEHRRDLLMRFGSGLGADPDERYSQVVRQVGAAAAVLNNATSTLVHSDLHLDNVMFDGDEPVILDWPAARVGPGAIDLMRILVESVSIEQRRRRQDELIDDYVNTLQQRDVQIDRHELELQLDAATIWTCWAAVSWFGSLDHTTTPRVTELLANFIQNAFAAAADRRH